jgi:hypothetical protein
MTISTQALGLFHPEFLPHSFGVVVNLYVSAHRFLHRVTDVIHDKGIAILPSPQILGGPK